MDSTAPPLAPATDPPANWGRTLRERTFRSLASRDYRLYFTGQVVSLTGTWMMRGGSMPPDVTA